MHRRWRVVVSVIIACWACGIASSAPAADPDKVLHLATNDLDSLDPHQWQSSAANDIGFGIFEALYEWDYLGERPPDLVPRTAAGPPEISADGKVWTIRIKPKIHFTDDPAFGGKPRELVAQDYVYSIKRDARPEPARAAARRCWPTSSWGCARRWTRRASPAPSSTTTHRSRGCGRSTATRCSSSSSKPTTRSCAAARIGERGRARSGGGGRRRHPDARRRHGTVSPEGVEARLAPRAHRQSQLPDASVPGERRARQRGAGARDARQAPAADRHHRVQRDRGDAAAAPRVPERHARHRHAARQRSVAAAQGR